MEWTILDSTKCELGEGPTHDPFDNRAWWFDIVGKKLFKHDFTTSQTSIHDLPFMASQLSAIDENTQLIAAENGLYVRNIQTGALSLHLPLEADNPVTRSNDGRVHHCGALWIGTMGRKAEPGAGAIYHFFRGTITRLFGAITIPNAICFSPDGMTGYYTDTDTAMLMSVSIDPDTALPVDKPRIFHDHRGKNGGLDGAVTDAEGNLWCALWGASALIQLSPEGKILQEISLPVTQPTCPCFIGQNLDRLLVTSAWQGKPAPANTKGNAGKTLLLKLPVKGKAEPRVKL